MDPMEKLPFVPRTWIDIDLDAVIANYHTACSLTQATVTCVLKADAYGHGARRVALALQEAGCASFAVSCAREALELRRRGIGGDILVMGLTEPGYLPALIREGVTLTVASVEDLLQAQRAAASVGRRAIVHLKLDTGFHRLGFECTEEAAQAIARAMALCPDVEAQGVYSHLGLVNTELDEEQHARFVWMRDLLRKKGLALPEEHLCDSIGLVRYPAWHGTRVRAGAFLFGVRPSRSQHMPFACLPTLAFRTTVAQIHEVEAGAIVGYGDDMPLTRDSRIATLCAGYGDGLPRRLSNAVGQVLIRGVRCPIVGLICMDQAMVDVTDVPEAAPGDVATLLGDGISLEEYSDWCHTNRNECITILSRRPIRVYHQVGREDILEDLLLD